MFPGFDVYTTHAAQHLKTAGYDVDDLLIDRDVSDLSVRRVKLSRSYLVEFRKTNLTLCLYLPRSFLCLFPGRVSYGTPKKNGVGPLTKTREECAPLQ